jgi:hypothetical protein
MMTGARLGCDEEPAMLKTYWITAEITRRAFMKLEAEDKDEARAMAEQLLEEGGFEGWEEDLPDLIVEEIPDGAGKEE